MASRKLNVLVYAGAGTTPECVRHCLLTLRRLLYPNYAVIPVSETVLLREPWQASCALLVLPGGADVGYSRVLNGAGNRRIAQYVRGGGRYLGLCAGGYYGSSRCEFEVGHPDLEVVGRRELGLFRGTCRGGAYPGFAYGSEAGARAVQLTIHAEAFSTTTTADGSSSIPSSVDIPPTAYSYYNGGGVFVDAAKLADAGVQVLASYPDDLAVSGGKGGQRAAVVYCPVGAGAALLTGPHPEFEPANMAAHPDLPAYQALLRTLHEDDAAGQARVRFLQACLAKLGLALGRGAAFQPRLTALHVAALYADEVQELAYRWEEILSRKAGKDGGDTAWIRGEADTFRVLLPDSGASAWPAAANVAAAMAITDQEHARHQPFSAGMALDLTDRALRYPKLGALVAAVANGTASPDEQATFRAILRAIADHDEEADEAADDDGGMAVSLDHQSVDAWRDAWRRRREAFDATVDAVYRAVGRSLLGPQPDAGVPVLDDAVRQELWSALVHAWEHKRTQREEGSSPSSSSVSSAAAAAADAQAGRLLQLVDEVAGDDADDGTVKRLVVYERGWPSRIAAFDLRAYFAALARYRESPLAVDADTGGADFDWGNQLMYAKVTTSTNTLLEANPRLLATLPTGFTFTATRQLAARGRGANVWLAPEGQLILSTVINHPHRFPAAVGKSDDDGLRPVVFLQYLAAIALVEAVHGYAPGFDALDVKIKWPNDIYARDPATTPTTSQTTSSTTSPPDPAAHHYLKIGGILSQCSFVDGRYQVVLGIGLNAVNRRPTTSLEALVPDALRAAAAPGQPVFRIEQLLACVLVRLEALYKHFCRHGFAGDLERRYYRHWLHANQLVTLEAVDGCPRARVLGISPDWGLLQVAEVVPDAGSGRDDGDGGERRTGRVWRLQSDENSFDYWKGLVRTKS